MVLPVHAEFAKHITSLKQFVELPPEKAALLIKKLGQDYDDGSTGISGFVICTQFSIYYCLLFVFLKKNLHLQQVSFGLCIVS